MSRHIMSTPINARQLVSALFVLSAALHVVAQGPRSFDCHFSVGEVKYDVSALAGVKILKRTRESPPSTYEDELRFDLCADLPKVENRPSEDQCPADARACLTTINKKTNNPERVTAVVPIALSSSPVQTSALSSVTGVSILFSGGSYPPSSSSSVAQSLNVTLTCAEGTTEPQFKSYENGQVLVEWSSSAACAATGTPKEDEGKNKNGDNGNGKDEAPIKSVGNGLGFFFLMLILALAAYFIIGAYYNYSTYGARGWDLIPHRDFWREVPYILQDVVAHLCSSVRTRRSTRGGYIAV